MKPESPDALGQNTRAVHGPRPGPGPVSTPIVLSATFAFPSLDAMNAEQEKGPDSAYYARYGNPTVAACERRLADLEGAERALLFSSGMAAIAGILLAKLSVGDHVVALREAYGGTLQLLEFGRQQLGWRVTLVGAEEPEAWEAALAAGARLLHVESPTNPTVRVVDLRRAAALAHARGALLSVDNTFASPMNQNPLGLGADLVMHSATKYLGGHSDLLAGVVMGSEALLQPIWRARRVFGGMLDPMTAWHIERSLKTLALRVEVSNRNALALAQRLERHAAVERVHYPGLPSHPHHALARSQMRGFGGVLAVEVRGGGEAARAVAESLRVIRHATSLGSVESLVSLPAFTSHIHLGPEGRRKAGIAEGLLRFSIGIEDEADLWADLDAALGRVAAPTA